MPVPSYGTLTDLPELLAAVKAKAVDATGFASHLVFLTLLDDESIAAAPPGNDFLTLRLGKFNLMRLLVAGGGGATYDGVLLAQLWHRQDNDQVARAADYLLAPNGILTKWLSLLGGVELFTPLRASDATKALTLEPIRNIGGFEFPQRKPPGWGRLDSAWSLKFNHRLT